MEAGRPRQNESPPTVPLHDAEFIAPMELCRPSQELFMISHDPQEQDRFPHNRQPMVRILAMPADTNPSGKIFGGWIMAQMDVAGGVLALEYAGGPVLTVAITSMNFHKPVYVGDLVSCFAQVQKTGKTSITVLVEVFTQRAHDGTLETAKVTEAVIVYVAVDNEGKPRPLPERGPDFGQYRS